MKFYSTRDAASLLGLSPDRVRSFARSGLVDPERGPSNEYRFSFQDLVLLRTAAGLHDARVPPRRITQALDKLRQSLPEGHSLSELRITAEEDRIVVHDGDAAWNPLSGQYQIDFRTADLGAKVAPIAGRVAREAAEAQPRLGADDWYELGLELDACGSSGEAERAYRRALDLDPSHPDAHVNLGRILHTRRDPATAETHYRIALESGSHATAAYNLGVALEDQGQEEEAERWYAQAIDWQPELIEAHYNLARLLEAQGDARSALQHLATCKRIIDSRKQAGRLSLVPR